MPAGNRLKDHRVDKGVSQKKIGLHMIPLHPPLFKEYHYSYTDLSMNQPYTTQYVVDRSEPHQNQLEEWMNEVFPLKYPSYHPHILHITHCVMPNGNPLSECVSFDHLFYFEHHMDPSRSFFMIEYGIPLNKRVIEHILKQVQEIHTVFSNMCYEDNETVSQEYMDMIQQMNADTGLTPDQYDLPFRIFFSHPVEFAIKQYLYAIHTGITSLEYDALSYRLGMEDPRYIQYINHVEKKQLYPYPLRGIYQRYHMMSVIRDTLKEYGYLYHVQYPLSEYFTPYDDVKVILECSKGRIEIARLVDGYDCYPPDRFPEIEDIYD